MAQLYQHIVNMASSDVRLPATAVVATATNPDAHTNATATSGSTSRRGLSNISFSTQRITNMASPDIQLTAVVAAITANADANAKSNANVAPGSSHSNMTLSTQHRVNMVSPETQIASAATTANINASRDVNPRRGRSTQRTINMVSPEIQVSTTATSTTTVNANAHTNTVAARGGSNRTRGLSINLSFTSVLTNFHAGYFRISLSLAGQALLWKTLARRPVIPTFHPSPELVAVIWSVALLSLLLLSFAYLLKCVFCFRMVKSEFLHHVGVNYLFVPWISCLLLLQSAPFWGPQTTPYSVFWWIFAVPVIILDVKIYGQWFTKGKRFLTAVANPTSQISVIGNLVGAYGAAEMGWKESAVCLFALGMVHYLVLFVTLYQRLSGSERLPAMLRPVFFLFFAAPSIASLALQAICEGFGTPSKMLFFLSLFLFISLVVRPTLFKRSMKRFNVAWWAYSFPVTVLALASIEYAQEVNQVIARCIMILLLVLSILVVVTLVTFTLLNSKMLLLDNDPIASLLVNRLPTSVANC